jgi:hypothetical protein
MSGTTPGYPMKTFAQANPEGPGQDDVPALLRRVADSIERLGTVDVHDLVLHQSINEYGTGYALHVYFWDE